MEPQTEIKSTATASLQSSRSMAEKPTNEENGSGCERKKPGPPAAAAGRRERVEEWRTLVLNYWKPLVTTLQPFHVFIKAKFCDPDAQALQEELLFLHERNVEAAEKLLNWLLDEQDKSVEDQLVRWRLFESAVKAVHPILHEVLFEGIDADIQEHQKNLLNFFMDDIARCVDPEFLMPSLYAKGLLSEECCQRLRCLCETKGQTLSAMYMVCNIHRCRSDWYTAFLELLVEKDYEELAKAIDDKVYAKIELTQEELKFSTKAQISSAKEETVEKVHGAAYDPRPADYAGVPSPEKNSDEPVTGNTDRAVSDDTELKSHDIEETELKSPLYSDPAFSGDTPGRNETMAEASDDEKDEDCGTFHSCNTSFELEGDADLDQLNFQQKPNAKFPDTNGASSWNNPDFPNHGATDNTADSQRQAAGAANDCNNRERIPREKELRGKNILSSEEKSTLPDNSNEEWESPEDRREAEAEIQPEPLELRPYQEELAKEGLKGKNVVIVAPTGSGKTHVALRLMQDHLNQPGTGVRKVVFLVNQVALAQQQYEACRKYLSDWRIKLVTGSAGASVTDKVPIKHLLMRADILVMTAQILVNALDQKEVGGICQFSMVVLDECHHTNLQHPFNSIMHYYMQVKYGSEDDHLPEELPQVVGLTASVGVGKAGNQEQARKHIQKLCAHLDADEICTVTEYTEQLALHSNDPKYEQLLCHQRPNDRFHEQIQDMMKMIEAKMEKSEYMNEEDTEALKDKLKNRPHIRGTSQYTGWVSELVKTVAMLDDAEARRYMDACRCMLKYYNESLVINDECDTQEALVFLHRQMNAVYDPMGKRVTEIDKFLKELFDKNLPYLEALSREQADTNPKLITLEHSIRKVFEEEPESRAIVFVKTRDLASALLRWMQRRLKALRPGKVVGAGPSTERGGMTKTQQDDIMKYFRAGDHKVIIATSVAEEGLDIQKCNLVIRYNYVTNEIAMVQARGRARAENSQFLTLASQDKGVQAKEEVNFIREIMMHEAIKRLQSEIRANPDRYRNELDQIQREEKSKRDAELAARKGRQLRQGEMVFRCQHCDAYAFVSSDVRKIEGIHHIVMDLDYRDRNIERTWPPKEYGSIEVRGRVSCKECGQDWGPVFIYQRVKFTGIKLENFRLQDEHGRTDIPKKWKQTKVVVNNLQPEELEKYREDAIAVDYVFLGD